jgi:hypothetical protein
MGFIKGMLPPRIFLSLSYQFNDIVKEGKQYEVGFIEIPRRRKSRNIGPGWNLTPDPLQRLGWAACLLKRNITAG